MSEPNRAELVGYLEEALPADRMARVEERLRTDSAWRAALAELHGHVDTGDHSVAMVWRRQRLTCLPRERWGAYLAQALPPDEEDYATFHLETVGCRWCQANVDDLRQQAPPDPELSESRRHFLQTSIGHLPAKKPR
jgi:hypothetical protein